MKTANKRKSIADKLIYTGIALVLVLGIIVTMLRYVYAYAEQEGFETLHFETQQFKRDINLQMISDRENLTTMARFAAQLYEEGKDYSLLFDSFKEIGLFESIGVLMPNNRFITKNGVLDLSGRLDFASEVQKGEFVTGRVKSLSIPNREVVRSAVPVKAKDGTPIAMIYGIVNLDTFKARYYESIKNMNADLFVLEGESGNLIINTKQRSIQNISELATTSFTEGYSYESMVGDLSHGQSGYTSFAALTTDEWMYAHYAPMEIGGWQIMLMQPEDVVFKSAMATGRYLVLIASMILLVMIAYVLAILASERRYLLINQHSSSIRKLLLGINRSSDGIYEALKSIATYAKARSAFVVDNFGVDYNYVIPSLKDKSLSDEDKAYFISQLLAYISKKRTQYHNELYLSRITVGPAFEKLMPDFCRFLKEHSIKSVSFACAANDNASLSILGVINSRTKRVSMLLEDIAICFTMAIYNQKHLVKTEEMAHTDALTGVANRMAYKEDIKHIDKYVLENIVCIFVDVNELNYYNNTYGHAAGDQMLTFVAETLSSFFTDGRVYRIGGDEFLIFAWDLPSEQLQERLEQANAQIEEMKYHVSIGVKYGDASMSMEDIVNAAEKMMYGEKAKYYQNREAKTISAYANRSMETERTGISEIDACMSVMAMRYLGVMCVMHESDTALPVLSTAYFSDMLKEEDKFSAAWVRYIHDYVQPESRRALQHFMDYAALESQVANGVTPQVTYTKTDGERVKLTIYANADRADGEIDTIWIFEDANGSETGGEK